MRSCSAHWQAGEWHSLVVSLSLCGGLLSLAVSLFEVLSKSSAGGMVGRRGSMSEVGGDGDGGLFKFGARLVSLEWEGPDGGSSPYC